MPHPSLGFPIPPFKWPYVGRQWPAYNVESDQAEGLVLWMPWGGGDPGTHRHVDQIGGLQFTKGGTPVWIADSEYGWSMLFDDAQSEYLEIDSTPINTALFTMACWFCSDDTGVEQTLIGIAQSGSNSNYAFLQARGDVAGDPVRFRIRDPIINVDTTAGYSANTWHLAAAVMTAANDHAVYIDDNSKSTDTTAYTDPPASWDRVSIGRAGDNSPDAYMSGQIADVRIYNRALTDAEIWQLYDPATRWELHQLPQRLWRLGAIAPPPTGQPTHLRALTIPHMRQWQPRMAS